MDRQFPTTPALFLIYFVCSLTAAAQPYSAATFQTDVTVPIGHALMGGGIAPAAEIVDPLFAKGFVLLGPDQPLVWCAVDWCEIRNDAYDAFRDALANAAGTTRERVFLAAVHQHDAPVADFAAQRLLDEVGLHNNLCNIAFTEDAIARTADALRAALENARPLTHYGFGVAAVEGVASNRRVVARDGGVAYNRTSATADAALRNAPVGLIDPALKMLSFWNGDTCIAVLSNYAVHPMSYYGRGGVSYDFTGMAREQLQEELAGPLHLYFSGCSGDVVAGKYNAGRDEDRAKLAERMHTAMQEAFDQTERHPLEQVAFKNEPLVLPLRETEGFTEADQRAVLNDAAARPFDRNLAAMGLSWRQRHNNAQPIDVPLVDFGNAQFVLMPAESFVGFQLEAQRIRPGTTVLVAGYGECAPGYIPTAAAEAESFIQHHEWCWVDPGAHAAMSEVLRKLLAQSPNWGPLPESNDTVDLPAQEWPHAPGPRTVKVYIHYPNGQRADVDDQTGLILTLHNWNGTAARGAPNPQTLADRFNLVGIAVDYLQSGDFDVDRDPPYDFGYLQALDALRALYFVYDGLRAAGIPFDPSRIYCTGGSGGGNVTLMANKLAPRTFAAVFDFSGMARLSDDIAFGYPAGSRLNAGYSEDPNSQRYLSADGQLLRDLTYPPHQRDMKVFGNTAKIIITHGMSDDVCPFPDKADAAAAMQEAGLDVETHFIGDEQLDGKIFKDTGHSIGDRTRMLLHIGAPYLDPASEQCLRREGPTDFDLRDDTVRYPGPTGTCIIGYEAGYPVGRFERHSIFSNAVPTPNQ
ncbi:MAG: DUF2920 family protein [Candidatus Hydrogenedentes bacterium]|nr:DUF2920 family protein [Candidatus Hydrogenedentota bacterium]